MISFKIDCPSCKQKVSISVKESDLGTRYRTSCPNCVSSLLLNLPPQIRMAGDNATENSAKTKVIIDPKNKVRYLLISNANVHSDIQEFEINQPYLSFGRMGSDSSADLELITQDKSISRKHCIFRSYPNGVTVEDISRGGTMLNNNKLNPNNEIYLKNGDILRMGQTFFKFTIIDGNTD